MHGRTPQVGCRKVRSYWRTTKMKKMYPKRSSFVSFALLNLVVDVSYAWFDPRIVADSSA